MAITVTCAYPGSDPSPGSSLKVVVLTGATEAGGAEADNNATEGATGAPQLSLTPNGSHSRPVFACYDRTGGTSGQYTAAANNTLLDNTVEHDAFCDGYYSGTTTAGTPVTVGCSAPTGTNEQMLAIYEILASGGTVPAIDASTPAVVTQAASYTCTTASFTPPAGAVLVALCTANNPSGAPTLSDTSGLTWTKRAFSLNPGSGDASIFTATVSSGSVSKSGADAASGAGSNPSKIGVASARRWRTV